MITQPEAPAESGPAPSDAEVIAERRTPAYTAVREYIQTWPPGTADPATVTRIWRALELGLDAMRVGQCESSHCVEDGHVIMPKPGGEAPDWTLGNPEAGTEVTHPAECGDACTEHHTYGPDCAALNPDWDPTIGLRERYAAAIYEHQNPGYPWADAHPDDLQCCRQDADAVLAARDTELTNSRRIWREQHASLIELYKRTRDDLAAERELSADLRARLKATSDACSNATTLLYRISQLHTTELSNEFGATECRTCRDPWPCDTATILAALEPPQQPTA